MKCVFFNVLQGLKIKAFKANRYLLNILMKVRISSINAFIKVLKGCPHFNGRGRAIRLYWTTKSKRTYLHTSVCTVVFFKQVRKSALFYFFINIAFQKLTLKYVVSN